MKWSDPNAPAWVQAVGTIVAILIAIAVPAWQRHATRKDVKIERARDAKERLERLVAGLRAEVSAAVEAAAMHRETAERTQGQIERAKQEGRLVVTEPTPLPPGSITLTDAIVYRAIAPDLGHFPAQIVHHIVMFYSNTLHLERLIDTAGTVAASLELVKGLAPRAQMNGRILIELLDKFRLADFAANADLSLDPKRVGKIANELGYPLQEVLAERGLKLG
jgi:hypothetical protein